MSKRKLIGIIVGAVCIVAVIIVVTTGLPTREEVVTFADANLETVVREAIAMPSDPIYPSDLDELTSLKASQ